MDQDRWNQMQARVKELQSKEVEDLTNEELVCVCICSGCQVIVHPTDENGQNLIQTKWPVTVTKVDGKFRVKEHRD